MLDAVTQLGLDGIDLVQEEVKNTKNLMRRSAINADSSFRDVGQHTWIATARYKSLLKSWGFIHWSLFSRVLSCSTWLRRFVRGCPTSSCPSLSLQKQLLGKLLFLSEMSPSTCFMSVRIPIMFSNIIHCQVCSSRPGLHSAVQSKVYWHQRYDGAWSSKRKGGYCY